MMTSSIITMISPIFVFLGIFIVYTFIYTIGVAIWKMIGVPEKNWNSGKEINWKHQKIILIVLIIIYLIYLSFLLIHEIIRFDFKTYLVIVFIFHLIPTYFSCYFVIKIINSVTGPNPDKYLMKNALLQKIHNEYQGGE